MKLIFILIIFIKKYRIEFYIITYQIALLKSMANLFVDKILFRITKTINFDFVLFFVDEVMENVLVYTNITKCVCQYL